jgi:selenocysteine-specific elongation factor
VLCVEKENIRLAGHQVRLEGEMEDLRAKLSRLYREAGTAPPTMKEALEKFPERKKEIMSLIQVMTREGELVRLNEELSFHRDALGRLREEYRERLLKEGTATPQSFREWTGLSRKFIIPLMEYFDLTKLTVRTGDCRILRERQEK